MMPKLRFIGDADTRDVSLIDLPENQIDNPLIDPETRQARDGFSMKMEIRQPLFSGFQNQKEYKAEKLRAEGAALSEENQRSITIAVLEQSFDLIMFARESKAIRQQSMESFQRLLSIAERRFEAGDVNEIEPLRIKAELSRAEADLSSSESQLVSAYENLRRALALPSSQGPVMVDHEFLPAEIPFTIQEATENALIQRGDLKASELEWKASKERVRSAKGALSPRVEAVASYDYRSSFYNSSNTLDGWQLGLIGSINVFGGNERKGALTMRKAEAESAKNRYESKRKEVLSRLVELVSQLEQHKRTLESRRTAVELNQKVFEQAEKQYSAGQFGLESLIQIEETLNQAQIDFARSLYSHNSIVAQLKYAAAYNQSRYNLEDN